MGIVAWPSPKDYFVKEKHGEYMVACYRSNVTRTNALWRAESALASTLPLFVFQLALITFLSRLLVFLLRPLRQPPVVAEILAGIFLGPSMMGMEKLFATVIFPFKSMLPLESVASLSLVYYLFLVGLDLDINPILQAGSKAIGIALTGFFLPIPIGFALHNYLVKKTGEAKLPEHARFGSLFYALALAITNFHDLTQILADLKLLHSEIGRTVLSAALITDLSSWVLFIIVIATTNGGKFYSIIATAIFILICLFVLRPALKWTIKRTAKDEEYNDYHICFILTGVIACGLITDACGCHSIVGAFMWGVILPKGMLKEIIMEKVEDFVKSFLLPSYFLVMGLRIDLIALVKETSLAMVILTVVLACSVKIGSGFLASLVCKSPPREGLGFGVLMNTKGLLALVIIGTGRDMKALGNVTFSTMLLSFLVMTAMVGPILSFMYKSIRISSQFNCKNIQTLKPDSEFRILACVHFSRNVAGIINLLGASNPSKLSPISVFAIQLVELAGRSSAMVIVHGQCKAPSTKIKSQSENIMTAFESFESETDGFSVHSLTAVSPYATMHEDICSIAAEKRVNLTLLPFHKNSAIDGTMEDQNPSVGIVNKNVLDNSPSSIGLFVDRGLGVSLGDSNHSFRAHQRFAVFFIGGPDDREALAYAMRMSRHPTVALTVVRFLAGENAEKVRVTDFHGDESDNEDDGILKAIADYDREKRLDNEYIKGFKSEIESNSSINYLEKVVNNGEETLIEINSMETDYSLYIVGRGRGSISPLTSGLSEWSDNPELGGLGDALVSSSFSHNVSVLVVQQAAMAGHGQNDEHEGGGFLKEEFGHMTWQPHAKKNNGDFAPFVNRRGKGGEDDGESNYY